MKIMSNDDGNGNDKHDDHFEFKMRVKDGFQVGKKIKRYFPLKLFSKCAVLFLFFFSNLVAKANYCRS